MMWGLPWWHGNWWMGFWMLAWWVCLLGVLALAVYGLVSLFNRRGARQPMQRPDPLAILKERYARGEITTDEYHRVRDELKE
ncbi:MAG: putative rane protein [Clostridia bacterium]|nr:putative rane protein [Clostridia bacterium]